MVSFVRRNLLTLSGQFWSSGAWKNPPPQPQPSNVYATLRYRSYTSGELVTTNLSLSLNEATNIWSVQWDSSAAMDGRVEWCVYSEGGVIAATQGFFTLEANKANKMCVT
jgi:hypothetical protein